MDFVVELLVLLGFNVVINMVDFMFKKVYFILNHTTVTIDVMRHFGHGQFLFSFSFIF